MTGVKREENVAEEELTPKAQTLCTRNPAFLADILRMPRVHTPIGLIHCRSTACHCVPSGNSGPHPPREIRLVNPWLRELAQILAAVAVEDMANCHDEPVISADAAGGHGPREPGSSSVGSTEQNDSGDRQRGSLSAEER